MVYAQIGRSCNEAILVGLGYARSDALVVWDVFNLCGVSILSYTWVLVFFRGLLCFGSILRFNVFWMSTVIVV